MDHLKERLCPDPWPNSFSSGSELPKEISSENPSLTGFNSRQHQQNWDNSSILDYGIRIEPHLEEFNLQSETQSLFASNPKKQVKMPDQESNCINDKTIQTNKIQNWDPSVMLNNLSFLEQKIHELQDLIHLIVSKRGQVPGQPDELAAQQQQLVVADLTSIIVQLISTAGSLLPSVRHTLSVAPPIGQLSGIPFPSGVGLTGSVQPQHSGGSKVVQPQGCGSKAVQLQNGGGIKIAQPQQSSECKVSDQSNQMDITGHCGAEQNHCVEEHQLKDEEDADEGENLPPGSYDILQLEKEEILAPHTHFCTICGKGFKRDANLRMHMRGHGDEYKTPAALAKPHKETSPGPVIIKRYSCPFAGCKRNKDHKKFQPLKTILCVKNHYKRTHCDKSYTCSRCNTKKFSVIADLKTHEKHCGKDKWLCSCGTTFSRKDKLFGHIALFQGHTPAISLDETNGMAGSSDRGDGNEVGSINFSFASDAASGSETQNVMDMKGAADDPASYFSPSNFDTCNFGGFHQFPRPAFDDSESSFSFLISGSCNYGQKIGGNPSSGNLP